MIKPKVFCRDCKYYRGSDEWSSDWCQKLIKMIPQYNEPYDKYIYYGLGGNVKGDCPHFELKRFKKIFKCFRRGNYG